MNDDEMVIMVVKNKEKKVKRQTNACRLVIDVVDNFLNR